MKNKKCRTCNKTKNLIEYHKHESNLDGYKLDCKECCRIKDRERFENFTPEEKKIYKERRKKNYQKNKETYIQYRLNNLDKIKQDKQKYNKTLHGKFVNWRISAKRRKIEWQLKIEDLDKMPLACYYTRQPLTLEKNKNNTISLDRMDSSKGYTKDNVVFCTATINTMKSDLSIKDFLDNCRMVIKGLTDN
jgi:hypothetical protein